MSGGFNDKENEIFVEFLLAFKKFRGLWDTTCDDYTNKTFRQKAYAKLLQIYQRLKPHADVTVMRKKIANVRTAYRRESKKVQLSLMGPGPEYVPSLWYFDYLKFLDEKDPLLDGEDPFSDDGENTILETPSSNYDQFLLHTSPPEEENISPNRKQDQFQMSPKEVSFKRNQDQFQISPRKKRKTSLDRKQEELIDRASELISSSGNDWDVIGKAIALQLEKLNGRNELQCTIVQKLISDALFYGKLNALSVNSRISLQNSHSVTGNTILTEHQRDSQHMPSSSYSRSPTPTYQMSASHPTNPISSCSTPILSSTHNMPTSISANDKATSSSTAAQASSSQPRGIYRPNSPILYMVTTPNQVATSPHAARSSPWNVSSSRSLHKRSSQSSHVSSLKIERRSIDI